MSWLRDFFLLDQVPRKPQPKAQPKEEPYDYAQQAKLVAEGDVIGLYNHLRGHPLISSYDTMFTIAMLVAEAMLNQREIQTMQEQEGGQE